MTTTRRIVPFDRSLSAVMWLDAFLSVLFTAVCLLALPLVAVLDVPTGVRLVVGWGTVASALVLAACGLATGVLVMLRMRAGDYGLPEELDLRPLPRSMRDNPVVVRPSS